MYNACTIMYIHIRSQASDWNCCVKRLREREREGVVENFNFSITLTFYSLDSYYDLPSQ